MLYVVDQLGVRVRCVWLVTGARACEQNNKIRAAGGERDLLPMVCMSLIVISILFFRHHPNYRAFFSFDDMFMFLAVAVVGVQKVSWRVPRAGVIRRV
jgi:hypothetical protein